MKTIVLIDGREAVPVRALPFVTAWSLSPDMVAKDMAKHENEFPRRKTNMRAFQYDPDGKHVPINPGEWEQVIVEIEAFSLRLRRANGGETDDTTYATWRREAPSCLPKACFVWRDEFEHVFKNGLTSAAYSEEEELDTLMLNFSPLVPSGLEEMLMDGFGEISSADIPWPWGNYETDLLKHLAAAAKKFWVLYDPEDPSTAPQNETVIQWLKERGVPDYIAQSMATILRADGLPRGPRKQFLEPKKA